MSNLTPAAATAATRIATVRAVGAGIRKLDTAVAEIVATLPDTYDPKVRGAVAKTVSTWINGDQPAPAQKTGPKGDQTTTDYGRGFDSLVSAVKRALSTPPAKTERLSVTWIDAEGTSHSCLIDPSAALFADLTTTLFGETTDVE